MPYKLLAFHPGMSFGNIDVNLIILKKRRQCADFFIGWQVLAIYEHAVKEDSLKCANVGFDYVILRD